VRLPGFGGPSADHFRSHGELRVTHLHCTGTYHDNNGFAGFQWDATMSAKVYELLDVPSSLTPASFSGLRLHSPVPPAQPRHPPEPKKDKQWPQAEDLRKLHERYGDIVEQALQAAREDGITEWYAPRIHKLDDNEISDIRQWQEMFKVMNSFGEQTEKSVINLSAGKPSFLEEN
jgi:hypothetical protein